MKLQELLEITSETFNKKEGISEQRVRACMKELRKAFACWREYPDLFVDFLVSCASEEEQKGALKLYFYQRVFLRAVMRHRHAYATFPRAYSKSFLSVLVLMLRCILFPGSHLFVTTGGKQQAAGIAKEKVQQLCKLIPGLDREINHDRGKTRASNDYVCYIFKNDSQLDIIAASQKSRGKRKTGGLIEEVILVDQTLLNEVIIPTMNVDRRLADGTRMEEQTTNKSQIYVTTAGWKNSYAYEKLMTTLMEEILNPAKSVVLGGTWRVPVMEGLLNQSFVSELKLDGTYNESSFDREYESKWSGDAENAYFNSEAFDKWRILLQPEWEYSNRSTKEAYYVIGVDVGRKGCNTECMVIKNTPQPNGDSIKSLVNIHSIEAEHFEEQSRAIKELYIKYKARAISIDANGLGIGLVDYMIKPQIDPRDGSIIPAFGVSNLDQYPEYKKYITKDTVQNALFLIKANAPINTEAFAYLQAQMLNGKLRFLIDEREAKLKLMNTKQGQAMTPEQRAEKLMPFTLTTSLREQLLNLVEENEGVNILLKQSSKKIPKDKFSALVYGMYYIKKQNEKKKSHGSIKDMLFFG